jgi:hypothetical protein
VSNQLQRKILEAAGGTAIITDYSSKNWNSITFEGDKHILTLQFATDEEASEFVNRVQNEDIEIELTNRTLLCDLYSASQTGNTVVVEALTLNE